ncbi:8-oxo-dGTP diphosphatase [Candidatus Saccharibacteria bacterium]|nr:8-oxo-dGTP diphosphatase [Candidatus Saccharibacteria bacterium]
MTRKELTLLFLVRDDEVLLAMKKRGFGEGRWNGVGGKVEEGESLEQALIRECQEEIEVTPTAFEKVADLTFNEVHEDERKIMHVNVFIGTEWSGEPTETEEMQPQWFKQSEIPYDECWSDDPFWLPQVLAGKKVKAEFTMDDHDQVTNHTVEEVQGFDEA